MSTPETTAPAANPAAMKRMRLDIALLVCSLLYVVAEFIFNARLLDTASDMLATADDLKDVEYFGRAVSGVGLSLLVAGFFARDGFRLSRLADQILFGLLAVLCPLVFLLSPLSPLDGGLDPSGVTFSQLMTGKGEAVTIAFPPPDASMLWIILPFIGIFAVLVSLYLKLPKLVTLAGVLAMTWPAMFFGQKILIERFAIHPTTWETRLDARYMQIMRTGFGHGIIALRDLRFDQEEDPALRSFLVLMGSMFMQFPDEAKQMIREKEQDIVQLIVLRTDIEDTDARYADYQAQVNKFRAEYFEPYQNASSRYTEALSEPYLIQTRDQVLQTVREHIDKGWLKMRDALGTCRAFSAKHAPTLYTNLVTYNRNFVACASENCRNKTAINYRRMVRDMIDERVPFDYWCEASGIEPRDIDSGHILRGNLKDIGTRETFSCRPQSLEHVTERLMPFCTQRIHSMTGFAANIRTRDDFENSPVLHRQIRDSLMNTLRRDKRLIVFSLPENWHYDDVATLEDSLARAIASRANVEWNTGKNKKKTDEEEDAASIGRLKPGLSFEEFVASPTVQRRLRTALGDLYYPGFSMTLDREAFIQNIVAPDIRRRALTYIARMEDRAKQFANGERLEEQGKEAVRFIYIPSIALFISLFLVMLTLARCIITAARLFWRYKYPDAAPSPLRVAAAWGLAAVLLAGFPYIAGSRTAQSESYQNFLHQSFERAPVTSALIDWTMRAEPIIYSAGKSLLGFAGIAETRPARDLSAFAPVVVFDSQYNQSVRAVQNKLIEARMLDASYSDGILNDATREALMRYQERNGLRKSGQMDAATLQHMQITTAAPDSPAEADPDTGAAQE